MILFIRRVLKIFNHQESLWPEFTEYLAVPKRHRRYSLIDNCPLRKQTYSNKLKILPPKTENFQIKILIIFIFLLKT